MALALALLIGGSLVVLGADGSIVTMPVLVYAAGLDAHQAATSLFSRGRALRPERENGKDCSW